MTAATSIEVVGIKEALAHLNTLDKKYAGRSLWSFVNLPRHC